MQKLIKRSDLQNFLIDLKKGYKVYGLKGKEGVEEDTFDFISDEEKIELNYNTTVLPPKKFFFTSRRDLFLFKENNLSLPQKNSSKNVLFGVHYLDLKAVHILDKVFSRPKYDKTYFDQRDKWIIIGVDHYYPEENYNFDLYLQDLGNKFFAFSGTKVGKELLSSKFFKRTELEPDKGCLLSPDDILEHPKLSSAVEKSRKSKIWDELAEKCFGCGICSYVCPLCYCFEIEDKVDLERNTRRERKWDSCLLPDFALIGGDINFRENLKDRLYNWYYHKFVRMPKEYGELGCVDCSRCIIFCPARINFRSVLARLIEEQGG